MLLGSFTLNKAEREKVIQDEEGDTLPFPATIYLSLPPVGGWGGVEINEEAQE